MSRVTMTSLLLASVLLACGGKDKQEAKNPESDNTASAASASASSDMPAPPSSASASASADTSTPPPADTPKASITVAAMKFTPPKAKKAKLEVSADGSVMADGKPAGKVASDHVEDASGKTLVSVGSDGSITGDAVKSGLKFSGDDVVSDDGTKLVSVADDGTVTVANGKKTDTAGKFDNGGAKKAAALVVLAWATPKDAKASAAGAAAKPAGGDKAGATKPAGKPAGGKK